jgi:transposase
LSKPPRRRKRYPGRKRIDDRKVLTGILFVLRTGIPWREMPAELGCGSGMTCLRRLKQWHRRGVFQRLYEVLLSELNGADKIDWSRALTLTMSPRSSRSWTGCRRFGEKKGRPRQRPDFEAGVADEDKTLADAILRLGTQGSGTEMPFASIVKALGGDPAFLRPDAELAVVVVTDAPDQSGIQANDLIASLTALKSQPRIHFYGVLWAEDTCQNSTDDRWNYAASSFEAVIRNLNGTLFPLCTTKFGNAWDSILSDLHELPGAARTAWSQRAGWRVGAGLDRPVHRDLRLDLRGERSLAESGTLVLTCGHWSP